MGSVSDSIRYLKGIGPKRAEVFESINISTIEDMLFYLPGSHVDRSTILSVNQAQNYVANGYTGELTLILRFHDKEIINYGRKRLLKIRMMDNSGFLDCVWFQGIKYFKDAFHEDKYYAVSGKAVITKYGSLQIAHPDFDRLTGEESSEFLNTGRLIPIYSLPLKLRQKGIGEINIRRLIHSAVKNYTQYLSESLPAHVLSKHNLKNIQDCIRDLHLPQKLSDISVSYHRLKFEEIFYLEILAALRKRKAKYSRGGLICKYMESEVEKLLKAFPFDLTSSQQKVLKEIIEDLQSGHVMNRLLQGDVGSGKTIVALIAMFIAVSSGYQAALMVPTEILAVQHYSSIKSLLKDLNINVILVTGKQTKKNREEQLKKISSSSNSIVVGTHALLENPVLYNNLGLVIIDEQHKFGVAQRSKLISKGSSPHVLIMTATPIPRTLSMTLYGDLDVSLIDEMPANRLPVKTYLRSSEKFIDAIEFAIDKNKSGYQSYVVYPLIEESEKLDLESAIVGYEKILRIAGGRIKVGLLHGRMKADEKNEVMSLFKNKKIDLLVSTTVIEVGVDVPDANIMIVNDSSRFGLSQLHQLRGRVGRSCQQAYCILLAEDNLTKKLSASSKDLKYLSKEQIEKHKTSIRLNALVEHTSGFDLSDIDLKLRGPGDIFGLSQSGLPELRYINVAEDISLIIKGREEAFSIIEKDPRLKLSENSIIKSTLRSRFSEKLSYSLIG